MNLRGVHGCLKDVLSWCIKTKWNKAKPTRGINEVRKKHTSVFLCVTVILLDLHPSTRNCNSAPTCIDSQKVHGIRENNSEEK